MRMVPGAACSRNGLATTGLCSWIVTRWHILGCGILVAILAVLHITSLRHKELTTDESVHYQYGDRALHGNPRRTGAINSSTMPFSDVHVMTSNNVAIIANMLGLGVDKSWTAQIKRGRYATIVLSLLLALYVSWWSYELYGRKGAILSLSLYVFDPNSLAHGQLVTADLAAALMMTVALYHFWQFLKLGGKGRAILSAVTLGLSQLAKYSCIYLYPIFLVTAAVYARCRPKGDSTSNPDAPERMTRVARRWAAIIVCFGAVSVLIINVGFGFDGVGTPLSGYTFKDPFFEKLQSIPVLRNIPLPVPVPYVQGLDLIKYEERMGIAWGNLYMAGNVRVNHHDGTLRGFPGYYFYATLFKEPIAKQVIFLLALISFFWRGWHPVTVPRRDELLLLIPILVYWIYFNFFFKTQIGIRHVLPVFVLATIFCGGLVAKPAPKALQFTALLLAIWVAVSSLSYYPHFLSYFNEFVPDRKFGYRYLADSNLDWRGNEWYLVQYLRSHPGTIVDPRKPQAGRIIVSVNALVGVNRNPQEYAWLREHFTPVDQIAYSFLVYDVPKEMLPQSGIGTKKLPSDTRQH